MLNMKGIKDTCGFKSNSGTLSLITTALWNKENNWVSTKEILERFKIQKHPTVRKELSLIQHRTQAKKLGIQAHKENKKGKELRFKIQATNKNFKEALRVTCAQGYLFDFICAKGATRFFKKKLSKLDLNVNPLEMFFFVYDIVIYPSVQKAVFEKPNQTKKYALQLMRIERKNNHHYNYATALKEVFDNLQTNDDLFNKKTVDKNLAINKQLVDFISSKDFDKVCKQRDKKYKELVMSQKQKKETLTTQKL